MRTLVVLGLLASSTAAATSITPTTEVDDFTNNGNCTLREAITAATSNAARDTCPAGSVNDADVIELGALTYVIALTGVEDANAGGDFDVVSGSGELVINGAGASRTIISGATLDRIFHVGAAVSLTLRGLTLTQGLQGA
ncbi:MAG: CSLREA domain-containing protein, partial [Myxococcaceae bacterium]|nr:CSLREA domain-containing protein [Myxococcaceae bacterium]